MFAATTIADEILDLKQQRKAILLAHHYQEPEIQELADVVGDSLELARKAREFSGDVIAFCGVWFMAETAKVLNPNRIVVVPDREASCSLVDELPGRADPRIPPPEPRLRDRQLHQHLHRGEGRERHPVHVAQRRQGGELHSRRSSPSCFCPTGILGNYVRKETGRENMQIWQGTCIVHATFPARRVAEAMLEYPGRQSGGASRVPRIGAGHGGFRGLHFRHHRMVRRRGRAGIHRDDGKRHQLLAGAGGARQALPLRGQRKLQLQRMPLHEAEHAREAA